MERPLEPPTARAGPFVSPSERPSDSAALVDHFFRHEYGRLVAVLTRRFGAARLEAIEDAVQGALEQALGVWARRGVPDAPEAWLNRVAHNRLLDQLRHQGVVSRTASEVKFVEEARATDSSPPALPGEISDDELRLLFACADDRLAPRARLVLCLKLLCGFATHEIAVRLFMSEVNVQKTLERGRARLRDSWGETMTVPEPAGEALSARLESVQQVIYLQFNEGYTLAAGSEGLRGELCLEALRLGHVLATHPAGDHPSTWALLSLMHLHTARLGGRIDSEGRLIPLERQDRSLWDRSRIQQGIVCFQRAADGDVFSRYHGEAAVLIEHCLAPSFEETRWGEIAELYELLERGHPSPLYRLNRAIAVAEAEGAPAGLALLCDYPRPAWLLDYYLFDATLGELHRRAGNFGEAEKHLQRAARNAPSDAERLLFEERLERSKKRDAGRD